MKTKNLSNHYSNDADYIEVEKHWDLAFPEIIERISYAIEFNDAEDPFDIPDLADVLIEAEALQFISMLMSHFNMQGRINFSDGSLHIGRF